MQEMSISQAVETPEFKASMQRLTNTERGTIAVALVAIENALDAAERAGLSFHVTIDPPGLNFEE